FINTNVMNEYRSSSRIDQWHAEYEQLYQRYANSPQPHVTAANLNIEIYPTRGEVAIRGSHKLVNNYAVAIDTIHLATPPGVETVSLSFDHGFTLALNDKEHDQRIYVLEEPLQPEDSLQLDFEVRVASHGFTENGISQSIVANGTAFDIEQWIPAIGYQRM